MIVKRKKRKVKVYMKIQYHQNPNIKKVAITERFRAGIRRVKDYATHILEHRFGNVPA
jgi:hypothetical protein